MKCEVTYEVKEITRYVIIKNDSMSGISGSFIGVDFGDHYGEFKHKTDAEKVRDALEADLGRRIKQAL